MKLWQVLLLFGPLFLSERTFSRVCDGERSEVTHRGARYRTTCVFELELEFLPGLDECKTSKNKSITDLQKKINGNSESINHSKEKEKACKTDLDLLSREISSGRKIISIYLAYLKSVRQNLLSYDGYISITDYHLNYLKDYKGTILDSLPELTESLTDFLIKDQKTIEVIIKEKQAELSNATNPLEKIKLNAQLLVLKDTAIFTDEARNRYPDQDFKTSIRNLIKDILEGRNNEISLNINMAHVKLIELITNLKVNELSYQETFNIIYSEQEKFKSKLIYEKTRLENEVLNIEKEILITNQSFEELNEKFNSKKYECSQLIKSIKILEEENDHANKEILNLNNELSQCGEIYSECRWKRKDCFTENLDSVFQNE